MQDISAAGHIHYPKNSFLKGSLSSILENYVNGRDNVFYAQRRHFLTIKTT
jgi:hypothetical protein